MECKKSPELLHYRMVIIRFPTYWQIFFIFFSEFFIPNSIQDDSQLFNRPEICRFSTTFQEQKIWPLKWFVQKSEPCISKYLTADCKSDMETPVPQQQIQGNTNQFYAYGADVEMLFYDSWSNG